MSATTDTNLALNKFDRTTTRWGRGTMIGALIFSMSTPLYLVLFGNLGISSSQIWTAFFAVAAVFAVLWIVEPVTYYPILGPAGMYQAFMIGNIANKLLPAALVAQATVGAKAGTRRGEFSAVMAICGAALVHVFCMLLFVGVLGTWLISIVPTALIDVARLYIFPSIIGAVLVQLIVTLKSPRVTVIAFIVSALTLFVLVPSFHSLDKSATGIVVVATAVLAWFLRTKKATSETQKVPVH